ncbi:MAG: RNA methyltransferase [Clostridiaceae bacterium]|jgi:TrmH family RNA methyltransferase|nr:RNA methyltransferase [Clostridiaceae bacterium]
MIRLTGSQNPVIKEVRSLRNKSSRDEKGLYFIEGVRFVEEAVRENRKGSADIRYIIVSDSFAALSDAAALTGPCERRGIRVYEVPDTLFGSISDTKNPQGILAVLGLHKVQLRDAEVTGELVVILDGIRDPGNMGTIIRTADAAGCAGVIIPDGCVELFNPKVLRATMGSVYHLPILHCGGIAEAMSFCREKGFRLYASHLEGAVSIYDADLSGNTALIIGSEAEGISSEALGLADALVRIPMGGRAESLNASVAAGVMIFEAVRQKAARAHF